MSREEVIELAAYYMGGLLSCGTCERCGYDEFVAANPATDYEDGIFARWMLANGWQIEWQEFDHEGTPGSGKLPLIDFDPASPATRSWSFTVTCPICRGQAAG